ncbi:glutamine-hydrolyzing carbamoyl-phosphate synthase small subunit [Acidocella sp.]|uniref:glutamine-hydrolyzing carbamoyl-phosphate synthase small subunit n=1 Tax=Acidocella sp. TaxID=50710 RepID=UPI0026046256|nr:glutamine-hydrolyzing carbamoyl-phosphate synthase small subunit [Acidocella sp.]
MHTPTEEILRRLGGNEAAAILTGVSPEAVRKWRSAGSIPPRHWPAIMAATGMAWEDFSGAPESSDVPPSATAALVLADGSVFWGRGFGAFSTTKPSELCFSTGLTGYQETLTDPSFAGQIVTFTFPHIGNVGTNKEDMEAPQIYACGLVTKEDFTIPSNYRATNDLGSWLQSMNIPGISGVDTRALTLRIRDLGAPNAVLAYPEDTKFNLKALAKQAADWAGLEGLDLAKEVSCTQAYRWTDGIWSWERGFAETNGGKRVVAIDYGAKRNILRSLASAGCQVTVVPATYTAEQILGLAPDGVFLSNGPGDPAATAKYAVPTIQGLMKSAVPIFGICLGHQLLATALGGRTYKMERGHRGANQPVKDLITGKVEITSQNHGFAVDDKSLPAGVEVTHVSLFDGSNEGIACKNKKVFSVQYHPEASPGPSDSAYLFKRFVELMG